MKTATTRVYIGADKEQMLDTGERLGLTVDAMAMFRHALNEVVVDLEVDMKTGLCEIVAVDGRWVGPKNAAKIGGMTVNHPCGCWEEVDHFKQTCPHDSKPVITYRTEVA